MATEVGKIRGVIEETRIAHEMGDLAQWWGFDFHDKEFLQ
jgi:hypothetical protein